MSDNKIRYREGYKYQLAQTYTIHIPLLLSAPIDGDFYSISEAGVLTVFKGYAWDGPSGPALDTNNFMRGSLVHDVLYQMLEEGKLPMSYREDADNILIELCKEDGMSRVRRQWVYRALRWFGGSAARKLKEIKEAP